MIELWEAAKYYVDNQVPWRDRGRSKLGVDCIGLIICSARDIGIDLDPTNEIHREMKWGEVTKFFAINCYRVSLLEAKPSDIVYYGDMHTTMIGILSPGDPLNLIYAPYRSNVTETIFDDRLGRLRGIIRLKETK